MHLSDQEDRRRIENMKEQLGIDHKIADYTGRPLEEVKNDIDKRLVDIIRAARQDEEDSD